MRIGIIGGAVAGSYAAYLAAGQGHQVVVYERRPDREKACGGGVTAKALDVCPELAGLSAPYRTIRSMRILSSFGTEASARVDRPFRIFSRQVLDSALRQLAEHAGARFEFRHVRSIQKNTGKWVLDDGQQVDFLVGAGGMADPLARHVGRTLARAETAAMVGWFVPGDFPDRVDIRLLRHIPGYLWVFPRVDHASIGIMTGAEDMNRQGAYRVLEGFMARYYPTIDLTRAIRYGGSSPMIMDHSKIDRPLCGENWALVGDAAGLCDPLTGEGIYYALQSARLLTEALEKEDVKSYGQWVRREIVPELQKAADLKRKFFRPWFWEAAMLLLRRSPTCGATAADFIAGSQDYRGLKIRTFKEMPRMLVEALLPKGVFW